MAHKSLGKKKAKEILRHGEVRGKKLTKKQRGLFGVVASGKKPKKFLHKNKAIYG